MTGIRAEVRLNSKLPEILQRFAIPLMEVAQQLVPGMVERIQTGKAAEGFFSAYGSHGDPTPDRGLFWVPPNMPQPPGYVIKATSGAKGWNGASRVGWAGYDDYETYLACRGKLGRPRNFRDTLHLWPTLAIRINGPGRVKVAFYGAHPKSHKPPRSRRFFGPAQKERTLRNSEVAFLASKDEASPMFYPTREEIARAVQLLQNETSAQLIGLAADAQSVISLRQKANKLQKRFAAGVNRRG